MHIELLSAKHIDVYVDHLARHLPEPGIDGIVAGPFQANEPIDKAKFRSKILARWNVAPNKGNWEIAWGLFDGEKIVGHIELIGADMMALRHRAKLGMGLEQAYRSQGQGRELLTTALNWARGQDFLAWVDLQVFAHNQAALKLYKSVGFTEVGKTADALRVNGESIDDWHMVLGLKNSWNLPEGFSLKEVSEHEFKSLVGDLPDTLFADEGLVSMPKNLMSEQEKASLKKLNANYHFNYQLHLVLFHQGKLAGWSFGCQMDRERFHMLSTALLPEFRERGLYACFLSATMEILLAKGFQRITSSHSLTNNKIIGSKLRRGFCITGFMVDDVVGVGVGLTYFANASRRKVMDFRVGHSRPDQQIKDIFKL